ncbi:hypothetical protein M0R45_020098 [Rubus argutus]|uniref:Protein FAR1-RELATED SEQUENCE n=1 Tax=Rubus argutus TaxID=59490 RepID=A0AAW1X8B2_RUBAR
MEQESSMRSISQNIAIATPDVKVTDNCGDGTQSNLDFESDIDLNGSIEVEDSDVQDIEEELEATKPNGNVDSIHSKVHQDLIPVIGMEFETEDDAHAFYNSCRKFEFAGILCSHTLKVLSTKDIKSIPSQYILERWTKDIKDKSTKVSYPNAIDDDPKAKIVRRYRELS